MTAVLFVCLGNICRSPTAHGVFEALCAKRGLSHKINVDSCGTGGWHAGEPPDRRATAAAAERGYDLSPLRARQFAVADFRKFDYILAMDRQNLADLQAQRPAEYNGHLGLFLPFATLEQSQPGADNGGWPSEVPDPYYGGDDGFSRVLDMVERASAGLLQEIARAHPEP